MTFSNLQLQNLNWNKSSGLIPAIIQDAENSDVLMLGYMNKASLEATLQTNLVTFYSRSKQRLWQKGESSGNTLELVSLFVDCDNDTILIKANPRGPACHKGNMTCFGEMEQPDWHFIQCLETLIKEREESKFANSYIVTLFQEGIDRIAQKVGEEGVEVALAAITKNNAGLNSEIADLLFHILVLLRARKMTIAMVIRELKSRWKQDP